MTELKTVRGKDVAVLVTFRLEWPAYQELVRRSAEARLSLSEYLRQTTGAALKMEVDKTALHEH